MSAIPSSAMPHTFAHEGEDLRDPHGGARTEAREQDGPPTGLLIAGAALAGFLLYRMIR